ncbi:hypothetical protein TNCV_2984611 [Trichonephila clavipes]|nr:hypothetical protein TNCV_2984611 [Trichonephila clavipes]
MMPPQTRTPRPPYLSLFQMMFEDDCGFPASSPDEYAMRIATQTESALICKEYSSPFIVSSNSGVPGTENAFSDGQALNVHTVYRSSCKQTTTVQSSGHGKTRYRSSSRLGRV